MQQLDARIARAVGSRPVEYLERSGGYTTADRYAVVLANGGRAFVKSAADPLLAAWLRREYEVYAALDGPFMPSLLGWDDDGERALLVLEDLSDAEWTWAWDSARVDAVVTAIEQISLAPLPPNTPTIRAAHPDLFGRWNDVERDPQPFLSLELRNRAWLERHLPTIVSAAKSAPVDGDALCHFDIRSDNICFRNGNCVLVDWNWALQATARLDLVGWLPSLAAEGGPMPWELLPALDLGVVALLSGVWASVAGLPPPPTAPHVRGVQRRQLAVVLDWLDRQLDA
jgi:Phosphotransferase enzyme family